MKLSHLCLLVLGVMLLWGCSNRSSSPILIERGVGQNEYEREYFAIKESMGIDKRLKDVFKQGYIEEGMTNDMVNLLWGPPDHESETDTSCVWEYYTREGQLITGIADCKEQNEALRDPCVKFCNSPTRRRNQIQGGVQN